MNTRQFIASLVALPAVLMKSIKPKHDFRVLPPTQTVEEYVTIRPLKMRDGAVKLCKVTVCTMTEELNAMEQS